MASQKNQYLSWTGLYSDCLMIREKGQSQWKSMPDPIEGFIYEEGYEHVIVVKIIPIPEHQVMQDGSSLRYVLVRIVAKTKKDSEM